MKFHRLCPSWKNLFGYLWKNALLALSGKNLPVPMSEG